MDLDKLQFKASVRSGWQAIDLGFLMARSWWRSLFLVAAIPSTLLFLPLLLIFWEQPYWAAIIVWWLKPFWERLPLYFASRRVFAEEVQELDILRQIKTLYRKDFFAWFLWRRLSFNRAFDAPVTVLEDLKGKARSQRLNVLHGKHTDIAFSNQIVCFCFEVIVATGLFATLLFFIPDSLDLEIYDNVDQLTLVGYWIYTICAYIAIVLVLPFHTMAGFALYLNRRIELEAWDIEITFRSLSQRKSNPVSNLVASILVSIIIGFTASALPSPGLAATSHDNASARQLIEQVLKGEDYGQEKTVKKWRFKNWVEENEDRIPDWLIEFVEWWENNLSEAEGDNLLSSTAFWLKLLLVGLFVCLLIYLFYRFRGPLGRLRGKDVKEAKPEVMFGLDVRPDSLPDDVPTQVMTLWQAGQHRDSLGLLYRASLSHLIERHALVFKSSHTEAECAALVEARGIESLSAYFSRLTSIWRRLAYGHQLPDTESLQSLCETWNSEMAYESH